MSEISQETKTPTPPNDIDKQKEENKDKSICSKLINFQSILTEQYTKDSNKITALLTFIEKIYTDFNTFFSNITSTYEKYLSQSFTDKYIFNDILSSFFNFHGEFFANLEKIPQKINNEIITPLKKAKKVLEREKKKIIISLKDIIGQLSLHQDVLNIIKKEYYEESQKLDLIEKNNKKEAGNENSNNIEKNNEILQKMSIQTKLIENKYSLYKKEVEVMKKLYLDCEKDYRNLKQKIQENDMKKNNTIYTILLNYIRLIINDFKLIDKQNNTYDLKLNQYKTFITNNTHMVDDIYNNIPELNSNWKYDFDISLENKDKSAHDVNEKNNDIINNDEDQEKRKRTNSVKYEELIIMPKNNYEIEGIDINYMELNKKYYENIKLETDEEQEKFSKDLSNISDFFKILFSENIIQSEQKNKITNILEKYQGNINCYIKFCDIYLDSNDDEELKDIYEFKSFSNFAFFSNLLKSLIENISEKLINSDIKSYILFDKIICIGEKSMYEDTYICKLLSSENNIFKKDIIWKNSIKNKLINLLDDICKKEYYEQNTTDSNYIRKSLFGMLFTKKDSGKIKNNIIELFGLDKYINIYKQLSEGKIKNICNKYGKNVIHELIKCYIRHMINYNYLNYEANPYQNKTQEFIDKVLNEFDINDNNNIKFFNLYYNSNIYSIKKPIINNQSKNYRLNINNYEDDKSNIFIIKKSLKYLKQKDKINLLYLNKKYFLINKYIYHQILKKDDGFNSKKRLVIWKIILKYKLFLRKYNYQEILNEVNKIPFNEKEGNDFIIMVDIKRTKFKAKNNDGNKILCNLLRCLVYSTDKDDENDKINYCQGMNFITALFYDIIQNEEETFHLLKSFFINGKFGIIFKNGLSKLKDYFTILEKLIFLYLPKIYHKLIDNQIQVNFFASPYFITLFTNIYYFHPDNANKFLLHSLDDFILEGWCSVFSTTICVLKYFEKKILKLTGEELIKFIVNDIGKSDLFIDENYKTFYKFKKQNWISKELLECLEEETQIEKEIKSEFHN